MLRFDKKSENFQWTINKKWDDLNFEKKLLNRKKTNNSPGDHHSYNHSSLFNVINTELEQQ